MKTFVKAVALLLVLASPCQAAEAVHGVWARKGHDDRLEFFDCDGQLCAREPGADAKAPMIVRHAKKTAPNQWKGDIFNPENGKIYSATVTLDSATQMTLTGCLIAPLCQSETWTRVGKSGGDPRGK